MSLKRPGQMVVDGMDRVEGPEGILKDHLHSGAVRKRCSALLHAHHVGTVEEDLPFGHGGKACDEPRDCAFPAP